MASKPKMRINIRGTARYPKLDKPDTQGEYADNKYKTGVIPSDEALEALRTKLTKFAKECFPAAKNVKLPIKEDKEGIEFLEPKTKEKRPVLDAKRKRLPKGVTVGGGSEIIVACTAAPYDKPHKGITLYLDAVQVISLEQGGGDAASRFEAEDGFDGADADIPDTDDEDDTDTASTDSDDEDDTDAMSL